MSKRSQQSVLFISDTSVWSALAAQVVGTVFPNTKTVFWDHGMAKPSDVDAWEGDWIICFKADLILSPEVLRGAKMGAINIHPATPFYRGIGGYYYAIDNADAEFGVTCHHMSREIDSGTIISVRRFPIIRGETPEMLKQRTAAYCVTVLGELVSHIIGGAELPVANERWSQRLYTRMELAGYLHGKSERVTKKIA